MRTTILLALLLAGCATSEEFARKNGEFDHGANVAVVYFRSSLEEVRWKCLNQRALACAAYSYDPQAPCYIYHSASAGPTVLEHEALHCRYGRWHG